MLRKEAKEVVCKYCNKVFKTRKAKEYYKKLKKSKRQNQENILLIKKGNDYI